MRTKIVKCVSIAALLLTAVLWNFATPYQVALSVVVSMSSIVVVVQAVQAQKYSWAVGLVAIALLFNPVAPVFSLPGELSRLLVLLCVVLFAISLTVLKTQTLFSLLSITGRTSREPVALNMSEAKRINTCLFLSNRGDHQYYGR
jgi:hypothetical protein